MHAHTTEKEKKETRIANARPTECAVECFANSTDVRCSTMPPMAHLATGSHAAPSRNLFQAEAGGTDTSAFGLVAPA
eukprot:scaffold3849_cov179-Amphora_coffeaeformis.AAC.7